MQIGRENEGLRDGKVKDLTAEKRRLVEVPYTATLAHTMNVLVANRVVAVPVAAPPGHWIGAGGSMILESDKQTGTVRKHYIGMVTMLDVLAHIAGDEIHGGDLEGRMSVSVSSIIGHCLESLSLWTLNPNTSIIDCMEVFSKGIHRALVPQDSHMDTMPAGIGIGGAELIESASSYHMVTQLDLMRFLVSSQDPELGAILSRSVRELGAVNENVFGVSGRTKVIDAIKSMRAGSLNAVPIVEDSNNDRSLGEGEVGRPHLIFAKGRKAIGTFSATDLRDCPISQLQSLLGLSVVEFIATASSSPRRAALAPAPAPHDTGISTTTRDVLVKCGRESSLGEVIEGAVNNHVHRVWVVDEVGMLGGLVSLTDMIRVIRSSLVS